MLPISTDVEIISTLYLRVYIIFTCRNSFLYKQIKIISKTLYLVTITNCSILDRQGFQSTSQFLHNEFVLYLFMGDEFSESQT